MARAEATALLARFRAADEQVRRYHDGVLPQSAAVLDAARSAYLAGRGGFAELLEAFTIWLQARAGLARREGDRFAAWAGLEHLAGGHLAHGDAPGDAQGDAQEGAQGDLP
jgi:outer membrane protein TolC